MNPLPMNTGIQFLTNLSFSDNLSLQATLELSQDKSYQFELLA